MKTPLLNHFGRFWLYFLAFGVGIFSLRYLSFEPIDVLEDRPDSVLKNPLFQVAFYSHVIFGPVALMTGPFQFSPKLRTKYIAAHRLTGKVYVVACLLGGLAGLVAAQFTFGGWMTHLGFSLLAMGWLYTTGQAWLTIRRREVEAHRLWMIRSFALTLAAVTLRIWLPLLEVAGFDFQEAYAVVSWLCWVPNAGVAEWVVRRNRAISPLQTTL